ncbi:MAG: hypothetical protein PHE53_08430 [Thermoguttaceae bacterium]|nr:hypothetical protein [Thermoguttaceae bacterium]
MNPNGGSSALAEEPDAVVRRASHRIVCFRGECNSKIKDILLVGYKR